jgi:hypothetical protein
MSPKARAATQLMRINFAKTYADDIECKQDNWRNKKPSVYVSKRLKSGPLYMLGM